MADTKASHHGLRLNRGGDREIEMAGFILGVIVTVVIGFIWLITAFKAPVR